LSKYLLHIRAVLHILCSQALKVSCCPCFAESIPHAAGVVPLLSGHQLRAEYGMHGMILDREFKTPISLYQ